MGYLESAARISCIGRLRSIRTTSPPSLVLVEIGKILRRIMLELFEEHAVAGDLAHAWRSAEHETPSPIGSEAPWRGSLITRTSWQKYLPPNCAPTPSDWVILWMSLLHVEVAEGVAVRRARRRQGVEIAGRGELHRLHREFRRGAADDDGEMIGRARRGAEREHLLLQEGEHAVAGEDRRRRLEQERFVGGAAALGDEQELVGILALRVDLDLGRHVVAGVRLLEHRERRELGIAQVLFEIGVARAFGERRLVLAVGPDQPALLAHDDRGAGVLAHRQHAAGGDVGVLEEIKGDEAVIIGGLGVVEDGAQLLEMPWPQQMIDVAKRRLRKRAQRLARDHDDILAHDLSTRTPSAESLR